jgi:DNA end-binding protein Ku
MRVASPDDMPRSIWKGAISFGLVTIPVNLYSAVERSETLSFHLLHKKDSSRIENKRFCKEEGVEVPWGDVVKGYEYAKGEYVVVTDEDFARARVPATQTFDVRAFVPASEVEDLYFDEPYYLAPNGRAAVKAYALIRDALRDTGRLGVGTVVLRMREHLAAIEPAGNALVLSTMRFAHEIRSAKDLDLPRAGEGWSKKEMDLARQLIDTLASQWDPTQFRDTYTEVLREVIEAKVEGKHVALPGAPRRPKVASLMKALQASLKDGGARKAPAKAAARGRSAARRRAARRAA